MSEQDLMPVVLDASCRDHAQELAAAFLEEWSRRPSWSAASVMQTALVTVFMNREATS